MSLEPAPSYRIEALGGSHDRTTFRCGVFELDDYFHHRASQDARRKVAAPFVMLDGTGVIVGYYTLSAYTVRMVELPEAVVRKLPRYPLLPATLLGRLAISSEQRGRNLGELLLADALHRSWKNTKDVGSIGVVVEALGDAPKAFYQRHGFTAFRDHPTKLFLSMSTIEKALAQ